MLGGLDAGHLGHCQHIALFHRAGFDFFKGLRGHVNFPGGHGGAVGDGLVRHVHHFRPALFIEMGQFAHGSASNLVHVPGGVAPALCQVVTLGLLGDAQADGILQLPTVKPPQVDFFPAVQTAFQLSVRRYANAAALGAELVAERGDETNRSSGAWDMIPSGNTPGRKRPQFRTVPEDGGVRQEAAAIPLGTGAHGHQFDESYLPGMYLCEPDKI